MSSKRGSSTDRFTAAAAGEAYAEAILDAALDAVITIDHRGCILEFNRAAEQIFGLTRAAVLGQELAELVVPPSARDAHRRALERWTAEGPGPGAGTLLGRRIEVEAMRSDGSVFPAELAISRVDVPGPPVFTASLREITARRQAEDALRRAEARYRTLVEQLPLAVYVDRVDELSSNVYTSPQIEELLGYPVDEWVANPRLFVELLHPDDSERVLAGHERAHRTGDPMVIEYRLRTRDGRVVWVRDEACVVADHDGTPVLQGFLLDITARKEAEEQLRHQAFHDPLTGLANRALFTDRVEHALVVRGGAAVVFLDLDDFKAVNDSLGHLAGDELLQAVARRLAAAVSLGDTIARLGGDEFAILVEQPGGDQGVAVDLAERVIRTLEAPFELDGRQVFVTASVGIGVGSTADELLRSADVAMYRAKARGKAQYVVYAARMDRDVVGRLELVADLRRASIEEEFLVHYQPTVELATGRIVSVEALVRWQHPTRGLLQPADFISQAEETGRILDIGRWVLLEASRQAVRWRAAHVAELEVSVNVSTRQIRRPELLDDVRAALSASQLIPSALVLEITESTLARRREEMISILDEVTSLGVRLALDDFGTGYSSLSLLRDLPAHTLKIDRSFVGTLETGAQPRAFVRAIVDLADALGLEVVAEGVESAAHVTELRLLGCRFGQGFLFARPLAPVELEKLLAVKAISTGSIAAQPAAA